MIALEDMIDDNGYCRFCLRDHCICCLSARDRKRLKCQETTTYGVTESPSEKLLVSAFVVVCGTEPQTQVAIEGYRVDILMPPDLIVEVDGHEFHSTKEQRQADCVRDQDLMLAGYRVVRFTGSQVWADAQACARRALRIAKRKAIL